MAVMLTRIEWMYSLSALLSVHAHICEVCRRRPHRPPFCREAVHLGVCAGTGSHRNAGGCSVAPAPAPGGRRRHVYTTHSLPNHTVIVPEHECCADRIRERAHLLVLKHQLEEREDALAGCRVGRDGEDDARGKRPLLEGAAIGAPPREHALGVCGDVPKLYTPAK